MQQNQVLEDIKQGFVRLIEALSPAELESNKQLLQKTKKVAALLAKIGRARESDQDGSQSNVQKNQR